MDKLKLTNENLERFFNTTFELSIPKVLMYKKITDEKAIEMLKRRMTCTCREITGLIQTIHKVKLCSNDIPNVGIYYSNKNMEVYRYFRKKNVPYCDSDIAEVVEVYFKDIYLQPAINLLNSYINANATYQAILKRMVGIKTNARDMLLYKDYCEELFKFDLERDIERATTYYFESYLNDDDYEFQSEEIDDKISRINKELQMLGIDKTITKPVQKKKNMA